MPYDNSIMEKIYFQLQTLTRSTKNLNECFSLSVYQIKQVFLNRICFMEENQIEAGQRLCLEPSVSSMSTYKVRTSCEHYQMTTVALLRCKWQ